MTDLEKFKELLSTRLVVFAKTDDWQDIWINGRLVFSGHSHRPEDILRELADYYAENGYEELTVGSIYFEQDDEQNSWEAPEQWQEYERLHYPGNKKGFDRSLLTKT